MDWASVLYAPIYATLGVSAELTANGAAEAVTVTVIDKTAGVEVSDGVGIITLRPAAVVRAADLASAEVAVTDLDGGTIAWAGTTWTIDQHHPRPGPAGESSGEIMLMLTNG